MTTYKITRFVTIALGLLLGQSLYAAAAGGAPAWGFRTLEEASYIYLKQPEFTSRTTPKDISSLKQLVPYDFINGLFKQCITRMFLELRQTTAWLNETIPQKIQSVLTSPNNVSTNRYVGDKQAFYVEKVVLTQPDRILFLGDLHGSVHSLLRNLWRMVDQGYLNNNFQLAPNRHLTFLGDMVDYGRYGIEVLSLVLKLKLANWHNVHIIRGNHEDGQISNHYGFASELSAKYSIPGMATTITDLFNLFVYLLPCALFIGCNKSLEFIQACHGGVEPRHNSKEFLENRTARYTEVTPNEPTVHEDAIEHSGCLGLSVSVNTRSRIGVDHLWGDGTGLNLKEKSYKRKKNRKDQYFVNPRRGLGFKLPKAEITRLLTDVKGVKKIIRGHKDFDTAMMFLKDGVDMPVDWRFNDTFAEITTPDNLSTVGVLFKNLPDHITLTSAAEGKSLLEEGYGELRMAPIYDAWRWFLHSNNLVNKTALSGLPDSDTVALTENLDTYSHAGNYEDMRDITVHTAIMKRNATFVCIGYKDKKRVATADEAGVNPELIAKAQSITFQTAEKSAAASPDSSKCAASPDDISEVPPVDGRDGAGAGAGTGEAIAVEA